MRFDRHVFCILIWCDYSYAYYVWKIVSNMLILAAAVLCVCLSSNFWAHMLGAVILGLFWQLEFIGGCVIPIPIGVAVCRSAIVVPTSRQLGIFRRGWLFQPEGTDLRFDLLAQSDEGGGVAALAQPLKG